jgi:hypothetical protein
MDSRDEQFKWFIVSLTTLLSDLELELLAHQAVMRELHPNLAIVLRKIEAAKKDPTIRRIIQKKYEIPLLKFQEKAEQVGIWKAVGNMLEEVHKARSTS